LVALLFISAVESIAAMPEPQRRDYVRVLLRQVDYKTEDTIERALPQQAAAASRELFKHLREWS
jgi:hypothetical protein